MEKLKQELDQLVKTLPNEDKFRAKLESLVSVYPFNEYEYMISALLGADKLTFDDYLELRDAYILRNRFLYIFEISAPTGFGKTWAEGHLSELVPDMQKPSKKLDKKYSGEYDFLLDDIRIEVKASRAVDSDDSGPLYEKALTSDSPKNFLMNFQQMKPGCCDVFIWIGVWRDKIRYWVLSSKEVSTHQHYQDKHHRGNTGEGQLHVKRDNIKAFAKYESRSNELLKAIRDAYKRQHS